jgi:hypothetical protein
MVLAFTLTTITCVLLIQGTDYALNWDQVKSGLQFDLPIGGLAVALAMFGITGVGAGELIYYPSICLEKGYARATGKFEPTQAWFNRAKGWMRVMKWDAMLSLVIYTSLTVAFYLIGAFIALYSTIFVSTATHARMFTDCFKLTGWIEVRNEKDKQRWIKRLVTILPFFHFTLFIVFQAPLWMVVIGGTFQAVSLIAISFGALYLRYKKYIPELRPTRMFDAFLWVSGITITIITLYGLIAKFMAGS